MLNFGASKPRVRGGPGPPGPPPGSAPAPSPLRSRLVAASTSQGGPLWIIKDYWVCNCHVLVKAHELLNPEVREHIWPRWLPVCSSSHAISFHSIWLTCSCSSWSLIPWTSSLCLTSCCGIFCQNFFTSSMSGGLSIWIIFFPSSL